MMRVLLVFLFCSVLVLAGCQRDGACYLPEETNTCSSDDDCLLAYCGVSCCPCELAVSRAQFDSTYCMATIDEGFAIARELCEEARETACDDVSCMDQPCPHPTRAVCDDGICHARQ